MSLKSWVKSLLEDDTNLSSYIDERIYALESMTSANVSGHPYLIYGLGLDFPEDLAEDTDHFASRQTVRVWIHDIRTDRGASYTNVNAIVPLVRAALINKGSKDEGVILMRYQGTSEELSDEALKTVFRIVEFEAVLGKGTA